MPLILRLAQTGIRLGLRVVYLRYVLASIVSLAVDLWLFLLLIGGGVAPTPASVIGYSAGIAAHWMLSSRAVFVARTAKCGPARHRQKLLFGLSALVGLAMTAAIVALAVRWGLDPRLAKLIAILVSFQTIWLIRRNGVFRA